MVEQDAPRPPSAHIGSTWPVSSAPALAVAVVETWQLIDAELSVVIGHRGVAALLQRSLLRAAVSHPWLALPRLEREATDWAALERALAAQNPAEALAGARHSVDVFCELLASLVGPELTERMLRPVWTHTPGALPAQESAS
jgi:hypothetical protein